MADLLVPLSDRDEAPPRARPSTGGRKIWWSLAVLVLVTGVSFVGLRGHLPSAHGTWKALTGADPVWLLAALALQAASVVAFAEQERRLLRAFGVAMPFGRAVAITIARSAMAVALPGGSAIAAAYGFQQFRARGANRAVAAAVTALCGVASVAGLALLYAGDALIRMGAVIFLAVAVAAVALVVVASLIRHDGPVAGSEPAAPADPVPSRSPIAAKVAGLVAKLRKVVRETAVLAAAVPIRRWIVVLALAVLNWLTDLLCLVACLHAVGLTMPFPAVGAAFLGAQLARQIPFTAGGIGVIEAELILAMSALGGAAATVTAAVLTYRILSCWAFLPLGAACWAALRTRNARSA